MNAPAVAYADTLLTEGYAALQAAGGAGATDSDLLDVARVGNAAVRRGEQQLVAVVADLNRRGVFTALGQRTVAGLVDLLGIEPAHARRLLVVAEHVTPRVDLQGQVLPPRLPGTSAAFAAGQASLAHVQVMAALMNGGTAAHLAPAVQTAAKEQIAAQIRDHTPAQLRVWGQQLLELLDQDGTAPADPLPESVNDLALLPNPSGAGGLVLHRAHRARRGQPTPRRWAQHPHHPRPAAASGHRPRPRLRPPRLRPPRILVRDPPRHTVGAARGNQAVQRRASSPTLTPLLSF